MKLFVTLLLIFHCSSHLCLAMPWQKRCRDWLKSFAGLSSPSVKSTRSEEFIKAFGDPNHRLSFRVVFPDAFHNDYSSERLTSALESFLKEDSVVQTFGKEPSFGAFLLALKGRLRNLQEIYFELKKSSHFRRFVEKVRPQSAFWGTPQLDNFFEAENWRQFLRVIEFLSVRGGGAPLSDSEVEESADQFEHLLRATNVSEQILDWILLVELYRKELGEKREWDSALGLSKGLWSAFCARRSDIYRADSFQNTLLYAGDEKWFLGPEIRTGRDNFVYSALNAISGERRMIRIVDPLRCYALHTPDQVAAFLQQNALPTADIRKLGPDIFLVESINYFGSDSALDFVKRGDIERIEEMTAFFQPLLARANCNLPQLTLKNIGRRANGSWVIVELNAERYRWGAKLTIEGELSRTELASEICWGALEAYKTALRQDPSRRSLYRFRALYFAEETLKQLRIDSPQVKELENALSASK